MRSVLCSAGVANSNARTRRGRFTPAPQPVSKYTAPAYDPRMRAVLCKAYGPPETLVVEHVPALEPKPGEAVVSVRAAGVNFPDVLIIENKYQVKPPLPFSPGSELAGVVKAAGDGVANVK